MKSINDEQKAITSSNTLGGSQKMLCVNESGLYALIMGSRKPKDYVFLNRRATAISQQALNGVWILLLEAMKVRYRVPYQLRHTMISYHANNDFPLHKLALLVGNSEEVIREHYLKMDIERISLPSIIK
ncbi:BRO family protein [Nostoc sp.]|uniref:BRO family protein n=1 Tax=Nostoc sp. TaxID=1180 RepID=UPI002FF64801